jgi:hypothetical protein
VWTLLPDAYVVTTDDEDTEHEHGWVLVDDRSIVQTGAGVLVSAGHVVRADKEEIARGLRAEARRFAS